MIGLTCLAIVAAGPAPGSGTGLLTLAPLLLIPVLYFVMIRPQQKRQKQWQEMLGTVKREATGSQPRVEFAG